MGEAIRLADAGRVWTTAEYARHFAVGKQTAWRDLKDLVEAGAFEAQGSRRTRRYVRKTQAGSSEPRP
jgi:predicted DNA-binding transcriptional regulator YafY